jgi:hypothetical protein
MNASYGTATKEINMFRFLNLRNKFFGKKKVREMLVISATHWEESGMEPIGVAATQEIADAVIADFKKKFEADGYGFTVTPVVVFE